MTRETAQEPAQGRAGASPGTRDAAIVCTVFGIGLTEMILIGLVVLMLFSPRELPGMMKTLAKVYGSIRRTAEDFRAQVMEAEELREPIEEIRAAYHGTKKELMSAQELARRELGRARAEAMKAQQKLQEIAREESRREAALKNRVSASDDPDAEPKPALGSTAPASSAPVLGSSAPVGAVPASNTAPVPAPPVAPTPAPPPPVTGGSAEAKTDRSDAA
jgi:Sec-independent protein translocase protein TatA